MIQLETLSFCYLLFGLVWTTIEITSLVEINKECCVVWSVVVIDRLMVMLAYYDGSCLMIGDRWMDGGSASRSFERTIYFQEHNLLRV